MNYKNSIVLVFAKTPEEGQVKTRLEPVLGRQGALNLHKALMEKVILTVKTCNLSAMELWVSSNRHHEYFVSLCNSMHIDEKNIREQSGADLGVRMAHAASNALQRAEYVVLLGADCPSVDAEYLNQALQLLEGGEDIVFGPAEDGGYVLLGLRRVPAEVFTEIPWGTADVMQVTRQRLRQAGKKWAELAARWDVDRPEDLLRLTELMPELIEQFEIPAAVEQ